MRSGSGGLSSVVRFEGGVVLFCRVFRRGRKVGIKFAVLVWFWDRIRVR